MSIILIRGLPGSGKTTYAKWLRDSDRRKVHVEADDYFTVSGRYFWDSRWIADAHRRCFRMAERAVDEGLDVIVANTFTQYREIMPYEDLAAETGVPCIIYRMCGVWRSAHDVPGEVIKKMAARMVDVEGEIRVYPGFHTDTYPGGYMLIKDGFKEGESDDGST